VTSFARQLSLTEAAIATMYLKAVAWGNATAALDPPAERAAPRRA
jgi:hypothetical protein